MRTLIISYDLNKSGQDYTSLFEEIKKMAYNDTWCRPLRSFWLIRTELTPTQCMDKLKSKADTNDEFFVLEFGAKDYNFFLDTSVHELIQKHLLI